MRDLQVLSDSLGRGWLLRCTHLERVKWYAPRVRHVVLDVWCAPPEVPAPVVEVVSKATNAPVGARKDATAQRCTLAGDDDVATGGWDNNNNNQPCAPLDSTVSVGLPAQPQPSVGADGKQVSWSLRWRSFRSVPTISLPPGCTADAFEGLVTSSRAPAVVRGIDLGPCVTRWDPGYLGDEVANPDAATRVGVHVCSDPQGRMAFVPSRNFQFETMTLGELVARAAGGVDSRGARCEQGVVWVETAIL